MYVPLLSRPVSLHNLSEPRLRFASAQESVDIVSLDEKRKDQFIITLPTDTDGFFKRLKGKETDADTLQRCMQIWALITANRHRGDIGFLTKGRFRPFPLSTVWIGKPGEKLVCSLMHFLINKIPPREKFRFFYGERSLNLLKKLLNKPELTRQDIQTVTEQSILWTYQLKNYRVTPEQLLLKERPYDKITALWPPDGLRPRDFYPSLQVDPIGRQTSAEVLSFPTQPAASNLS